MTSNGNGRMAMIDGVKGDVKKVVAACFGYYPSI
jgi:hypothetical protein